MPRSRSRFLLRLATVAVAACAALAALPALASAASEITVNTTADEAPVVNQCLGSNPCSLRQAINTANELAEPIINLPAGTYKLTLKGAEEDGDQSGDLDVGSGSKIQIRGAGARTTVIDATGLEERVLDVQPLGSLSLSKVTVTHGEAIDVDGGGIRVVEGSLNLDQVAVKDNVSTRSGAGGGIAAKQSALTVSSSLIAGNRNSGDGGGIFAETGNKTPSTTTIVNSTIANNVVDTSLYPEFEGWGAYGGGIEASGKVVMQNDTVAGNSIRDGNGGNEGEGTGLGVYPDESEFLNTIVYGNTGSEVEFLAQCNPLKPDERLFSAGHNLEQQPPAGEQRCFETPTDLIADPLLAALADNGGETDTMALLTGSPAINGADAARCPSTDQRGLPRPSLGGCDIGAFEVQPVPPPPPPPVITAPTIKRKGKVIVKKAGKTFLVKPGFVVTCPATDPTCTGTIKAKAPKLKIKSAGASAAKKVTIGKATFSVLPGKSKKLSLKLNSKGAKMLRLLGKVRARFEVSSRAGTGPVAKASATLKLKLPAKPRHK